MKELFHCAVDDAIGQVRGSEVLLANFAGEVSDFVRFNQARVRQAMTIRQATLTLSLIDGGRRDTTTLTLSGERSADRALIAHVIDAMRTALPHLPVDPYLHFATSVASTDRAETGALAAPAEALDAMLDAAAGLDLVGIYASGPIFRGFANSLGQRNWHSVESFNVEWSLFHAEDKAVKSAYAGAHFDAAELRRRIEQAGAQLGHLAKPAKTITPGSYRAYLAPAALDELLWMFNWDGVSAKAQRTQQSSLQRLVDGEARLSERISLRENTAQGLAPGFDQAGFRKPEVVDLVRAGRYAGALVSPRTAREYDLEANGANDDESMQSLDLDAGGLPAADALSALDRGVWIGNLHYLNYSDRRSGRVTGMTRFASFWVEHGTIQAPLSVMRFDDTFYRLLGDGLVDLTAEREMIINAGTYERRSVETSRTPGALLGQMTLTL